MVCLKKLEEPLIPYNFAEKLTRAKGMKDLFDRIIENKGPLGKWSEQAESILYSQN